MRAALPVAPATASPARLGGIDALRGIVIVLMALDHCRDYYSSFPYRPTDLSQADWTLFLTRWVTHFCAPVFVLLAGSSAWLHREAAGLSRAELQRFLLTRGLWILLLEVSWNNFMWRFALDGLSLQVLWALGGAMVALSALLWLPRGAIIAVGAVLLLGHNLLDGVEAKVLGSEWSPAALAWYLLHEPHVGRLGNGFELAISYPLLPWIGVMALGYGLGAVFTAPAAERERTLFRLGLLLTLGFVLLRLGNLYGEPQAWTGNPRGALYTALGWLNLSKYPPSLHYLLMTLGPALMLLSRLDRWRGPVAELFIGYGRVPMFFYLLHLPLIHAGSVLARYLLFGPAAFEAASPQAALPSAYVPSLLPVYGAWLLVLALLHPACRWYGGYKRRHREQRWLSYL